MDVGQGPNWGCSAEKKTLNFTDSSSALQQYAVHGVELLYLDRVLLVHSLGWYGCVALQCSRA
jgi:hypothetical protein